jgi:hypothetical protein
LLARRSDLRILRSKFSQAQTNDPSVRPLMSEFASTMVEGVDPASAFSSACSTIGLAGPEPSKLAARMGATSLIADICRQSGLPDPGIDPAGRELMRGPGEPDPERR